MKRHDKIGRKAQVFSIDVLFSLLPIMMILGASLQYLYIGEEQMKTLSEGSYLETLVQGMAESIVSSSPPPEIMEENCDGLEGSLSDYSSTLPAGYVYHARADSYFDATLQCDGNDDHLWSTVLEGNPPPPTRGKYAMWFYNNTAASELRFMLESDSSGDPQPGQISGISFSVWENK